MSTVWCGISGTLHFQLSMQNSHSKQPIRWQWQHRKREKKSLSRWHNFIDKYQKYHAATKKKTIDEALTQIQTAHNASTTTHIAVRETLLFHHTSCRYYPIPFSFFSLSTEHNEHFAMRMLQRVENEHTKKTQSYEKQRETHRQCIVFAVHALLRLPHERKHTFSWKSREVRSLFVDWKSTPISRMPRQTAEKNIRANIPQSEMAFLARNYFIAFIMDAAVRQKCVA